MIYDSNAPAPLKYTDPTFQTLLFVRANIYDTSGGSPSLAGTVNLALIDNGTYYGKFTFTAGKTYLVQKLVYTDGTYTTVDQTFAQDNDDVQCIDLRTAELDVAVSSRNSTAHFDAVIGTPAGASVSADIAEIEAETDGIAAIPTNPLLTTDSRLNHLDADISSRLPTSSYTAPDNAGIASIEVAVAAIPTNPVLVTDSRLNHLDADVSTRLPTSSYVAPDNADVAAIKVVTDQFSFTGGHVNAHCDNAGGGGTNIVGIEMDFQLQTLSTDIEVIPTEVEIDLQTFEMEIEIDC